MTSHIPKKKKSIVCNDYKQTMTRSRGFAMSPSKTITFRRAVDSRSRLDPPLPETYFGNAVLGDHMDHYRTSAGELLR